MIKNSFLINQNGIINFLHDFCKFKKYIFLKSLKATKIDL